MTLGRLGSLCLAFEVMVGFMHVMVAYGFQRADDDPEMPSLTDQLFDAALCELAVVSRGQPCVIAGDFNVEPTRGPSPVKRDLGWALG